MISFDTINQELVYADRRTLYLPYSLEHAAHSAYEANLLLEDLHAMPLGHSFLRLFVLLLLLLLQDLLYVLPIKTVSTLVL